MANSPLVSYTKLSPNHSGKGPAPSAELHLMPWLGSLVWKASATVSGTQTDRQAAITPSVLTVGSAFALMSRTVLGVPHPETMTSVQSLSCAHLILPSPMP